MTWKIKPSGELIVEVKADARENLPFLPRFGLRMFLPKCMTNVEYFGYGPYESYLDKRQASCKHLYRNTVKGLHEDYLKPQENGSHHDCTYLQISGPAVRLNVTGESFSFNASRFTQEELTKKAHAFELEPCGSTVLCVDALVAGIGSNSCGPQLDPKYRPGKKIDFACTFTPENIR